MCIEIEAKLKVDSLQQVADRLTELGAVFLHNCIQKDSFFDEQTSALTRTDRCFRLRRQLIGPNEKIFLTYKGPKQKDNFKKRQEIEIEINNADLAEKFFSALGYNKVLAFEKKRSLWRLDDCLVALDELHLLGNFVEIEGPDDEKIAAVQAKLQLSDLPHIQQSYASLMAKKLHRRNEVPENTG